MLLGDLTGRGMEAWLGVVGPGTDSPLVSAELRHAGGALSRPAPAAAPSTRCAAVPPVRRRDRPRAAALAPTKRRLAAMTAAMKPWDAGYLNFSSAR